MNAAVPASLSLAPPLALRVLAWLAPTDLPDDAPAEAQWLAALRADVQPMCADLPQTLALWQHSPPLQDQALHGLCEALALNPSERMALALCLVADTDVVASRALAWLQAPLRDHFPTLGLIACLDAQRGLSAAQSMAALLDGGALASGLLQLESTARALPDARLRLPAPLVLALVGGRGHWPGVLLGGEAETARTALPPSIQAEAALHARHLLAGQALVVRSGHPREARAACAAVAQGLGLRPVFIEGDTPAGLLPWLLLQRAMPVWVAELMPGERRRVPLMPGPGLPMLMASGPEGSWELESQAVASWVVPLPLRAERAALWAAAGLPADSAQRLARHHRHATARIHELAHAAHGLCRGEANTTTDLRHVARAARSAGQDALGAMARLMPDDVPEEALVLPPALRHDLLALVDRCRHRDGLVDGLGYAARARYQPGVRALLVGASGTGKTLACCWIATQLQLPLYRVDIASVSSKYIGETEKNLAELFARAEHAEVVLLFDEADALFARRTDVKDSNDRFANQQTNYLLQRIEAFEGVALLTSNSRARFDSAFTRRLDAIIDFPLPAPDERRALWLAHLGTAHTLNALELNRLAVACDFTGGHIRNAVLAARAMSVAEPIGWAPLRQALDAEYRKLGKRLPVGLVSGR